MTRCFAQQQQYIRMQKKLLLVTALHCTPWHGLIPSAEMVYSQKDHVFLSTSSIGPQRSPVLMMNTVQIQRQSHTLAHTHIAHTHSHPDLQLLRSYQSSMTFGCLLSHWCSQLVNREQVQDVSYKAALILATWQKVAPRHPRTKQCGDGSMCDVITKEEKIKVASEFQWDGWRELWKIGTS